MTAKTPHFPDVPMPAEGSRAAMIMDAAEALFAEQGFVGVSIRDIAAVAKVNVATISYHFGSKERLFEALFARRVIPVNKQRLKLLQEARAGRKSQKARLRAVIEAFLRPPLSLGNDSSHGNRGLVVMQFLSRVLAMPGEHAFLTTYYGEVRTQFVITLHSLLPQYEYRVILWRYNLMVGALIYAMGGPERMLRLPAGVTADTDEQWNVENAIRQVVDFCEGAFSA